MVMERALFLRSLIGDFPPNTEPGTRFPRAEAWLDECWLIWDTSLNPTPLILSQNHFKPIISLSFRFNKNQHGGKAAARFLGGHLSPGVAEGRVRNAAVWFKFCG